MLVCILALFCFAGVGIVWGANEDAVPYSRNGNRFERVIYREISDQEIPDSSDYLKSMNTLFEALKKGDQVNANDFNRSLDGLNQYYQSVAYDTYQQDVNKSATPIDKSLYEDPISLPDATDVGGDVEFFEVKVLGFPSFKKNVRVSTVVDSGPYVRDVTVHLKGTSDVVIFHGFFKTYGEKFYFVYHTYGNKYHSDYNKIRTTSALVKPHHANDTFEFQEEVFVHTYDSSLEHYSDVNSTLFEKFQKALREIYLPKLAVLADTKFQSEYDRASPKLGEKYRGQLLPTIVQAANQFLRLKGIFKSEFTPVTYIRPGKKLTLTYSSVFDGLLNYESYNHTNSKKNLTDSILSMEDTLTFYYPETGDKNASFTIITANNVNAVENTTYSIKSVIIESAFKADLSTYPALNVYADVNRWPFTKSGFYARINLVTPAEVYDFVVRHAGKEIAMGIGFVTPPNGTIAE